MAGGVDSILNGKQGSKTRAALFKITGSIFQED